MRALVISDIHGNYAALRAVLAEPHDLLLCLGDLVTYGPAPWPCVREIHERTRIVVQGNHDRALGQAVSPRCSPPFRWLADATAGIGRAQVPRPARAYLGALPRWAWAVLDGVRFLAVHATPSDPLYGYLDPDPALWTREVAGIDVDLLLVGHTHIQFEMTIGSIRIVNPGSAGQPKDGDPRAAYAIIEDGQVSLQRAEYDVDETVAALRTSGVDPKAVTVLAELLRTGTMPSAGQAEDARIDG